MLVEIIFLCIGLIGLWVGADFLVKGAKNIASSLGLSQLFIGLAFVSIGTSIPEIAVSVAGAFDRLGGLETSGIVVGNKLGSALVQVSFFMGVLAFLVPLYLSRKDTIRHGSFLIASILLFFALSVDGTLNVLDGVILLVAYVVYYVFLIISNINHREHKKKDGKELWKNIIYAIFGIVLVIVTSDIVVGNGIAVAEGFGVSQSLIGVLLIGFGTGLPEFSVAIASWKNKAMAVSMGDLIGSNICDILLALGAGTVISGFVVDPVLLGFDFPVLLVFSFLVLLFLYTKQRITKWEGGVLVGLFLLYAAMKIFMVG